jgi:CHAD domain-containing protein
MLYFLNTRKAYARNIAKICARVEKILGEFSKTHSVESLHDFRTSVRRLQAAYSVLPKNVRKSRKLKSYFESRQKLFKASAEVRDLDIVLSRIAKYKPQTQPLILKIQQTRTKKAVRLAKKAKIALEFSAPKTRPGQINPDKLAKRIEKLRGKLNSKLTDLNPVVTSDPTKIKEIHAFRKFSKRLRYVLEFVASARLSKEISRLREYQDMLGEMRDAQLTYVSLSESNAGGKYSEFVESEKKLMDGAYLAFVQSLNKVGLEAKPEQERKVTLSA